MTDKELWTNNVDAVENPTWLDHICNPVPAECVVAIERDWLTRLATLSAKDELQQN